MKKFYLFLLALAVGVLSFAGCSTVDDGGQIDGYILYDVPDFDIDYKDGCSDVYESFEDEILDAMTDTDHILYLKNQPRLIKAIDGIVEEYDHGDLQGTLTVKTMNKEVVKKWILTYK